jgi:hypothetical protein
MIRRDRRPVLEKRMEDRLELRGFIGRQGESVRAGQQLNNAQVFSAAVWSVATGS